LISKHYFPTTQQDKDHYSHLNQGGPAGLSSAANLSKSKKLTSTLAPGSFFSSSPHSKGSETETTILTHIETE
jgi:hypothetical protein